LSGLESTDDADWFVALLRTLREVSDGPDVEGSVLYTNASASPASPSAWSTR